MSSGESSGTNERLEEAIRDYLDARERGETPSLKELQDRQPDLAAELAEFVANYEEFRVIGDPPASLRAPSLRAGERLGDYEILEELGRGGMGVVFKARQVSLDRIVALKLIIAGQLASEEEVRRFRFEAQTAARLFHPNIVAIHEVGESQGLHYFSMQFVEGGALSKEIGRFRGRPKPIARLVETICQALDEAHRHGVLHRDLKPANVLLDDAGEPHVSDFGLSKLLGEGPHLTRAGSVLGTPSYLAPEQAAPGGQRDTPATDVYGLGAILYELLTGKPPFQGRSSMEVLERVRTREPIRPRALDRRIPVDLESICLQCLEKEPGRRYVGARELSEDLRRFQGGRPVLARKVTAAGRAWRACRRNPVVSSLTACIILALLVLMAGLGWSRREMEDSLWRSYLERSRAGRVSARPGQRLSSLAALERAAAIRVDASLRDEAIACLARVDLGPVLRTQLFPGGVLGDPWIGTLDRHPAAIDSDFRRCARGDEHGGVDVIDVASGARLRFLPAGATPARRLTFSPDGRFLAVRYRDRRLRIWDLDDPDGAEKPRIDVPSVAEPEPWDFRPDCVEIAFGFGDGSVGTGDLATGGRRAVLRSSEARTPVLHVRYRPDQSAIAVCRQGKGPIEILSAATGEVLKRFPSPGPVSQMAWELSGERLAIASGTTIHLLTMGSEPGMIFRGRADGVDSLGFHPQGDLFVSSGTDFLRMSSLGSGLEVLRVEKHSLLGFSKDGASLGSISSLGELTIWSLEGTSEWRALTRLPTGQGMLRGLGVDSESRLAAVSTQRGVWIIDLTSGRKLARLPTGDTATAIFSPSGDCLLTWGQHGLHRWPLVRDRGEGGRARRRLGPPVRVEVGPPGSHPGPASLAADGSTLAVVTDASAGRIRVLDVMSSGPGVELVAGGPVEAVAVSPDGRRAAAAGRSSGIVEWDLRGGPETLRRRPGNAGSWVGFSPDGLRLVVGSLPEFSFLEIESGRVAQRVSKEVLGPSLAAVSSAAGLLAFRHSRSSVKLLDAVSGRDLATIETPEGSIEVLCFDSSGRKILVGGPTACLHVLDLARARATLLRAGIDCNLGAAGDAGEAGNQPDLDLEVDVGELGR